MYCSKCGVQNNEGATHCTNCGDVLIAVPAQPVAGPTPPAILPVEPKTCGVAIAALILGILSMFCWIFMAVPAIACGIAALILISKSNGQLKGKGLALTGLVIPIVMIFVMPLLMAIFMPALAQTKKIAMRVVCGTNLKGLSTAMMVYANDYDGILPTENWCDLLIEEADVSPKSFVCLDSDTIEGESSYAMNESLAGKNSKQIPPDVVLFFETDKGKEPGPRSTSIKTRRYFEYYRVYDDNTFVYKDRFNQFGGPEDLVLRHIAPGSQYGCNVAFADGHTEFVTEDRIAGLRWTAE